MSERSVLLLAICISNRLRLPLLITDDLTFNADASPVATEHLLSLIQCSLPICA